uniref:Solute carrier family 13 member 2 n=1 Tax=Bos taurus TaxID=9913 RepID=A0A3Q1LWY2_BOVIN
MATCWQGLWAYRFYLIVFFLPIFLLPLPILVPTKEACCAYTIILMALLWCTEALPLAVTAFLPVIMFPMMGIMTASTVSLEYLKDTNILFIGGMMVALAVETWNLHKRIALRVLLIIGVRPALLILGFMLVTAFLSMWISNTATTAMMLPIAHAVLEQLHKMPTDRDVEEGRHNPAFELQEQKEETKLDEKDNKQDCPALPTPSESKTQQNKEQLRFSQGLSLCVCYSASIGGIATLTGTTPNLVLQGQVNSIFPRNGNVVNFASWFGFAFPAMIILLLLSWVWLQILFLGFDFRKNFGLGEQSKNQERAAFEVIRREHKLLGPINFAEKAVTFLFVLLVVLWFTREPGFFTGWGNLAFSDENGKSMTSDGTVAILIAVIMFIVPSKIPGLTQKPGNPGKLKAPPALLTWDIVKKKMPWNIVILLGGGFALAKGSEVRDPIPSAASLVGDPVTGKEGPCFSPIPGSPDPPHGSPLVGRAFAAAGETGKSPKGGRENTGHRELCPVGFSKPKRRQDFLVSRDCTQDHPGPSLTPCWTENTSALTPGSGRKALG